MTLLETLKRHSKRPPTEKKNPRNTAMDYGNLKFFTCFPVNRIMPVAQACYKPTLSKEENRKLNGDKDCLFSLAKQVP